ncbi:MAG: hypothetical protein ACTSWN_14730, partial [Promethearchaeota archaeon]
KLQGISGIITTISTLLSFGWIVYNVLDFFTGGMLTYEILSETFALNALLLLLGPIMTSAIGTILFSIAEIKSWERIIKYFKNNAEGKPKRVAIKGAKNLRAAFVLSLIVASINLPATIYSTIVFSEFNYLIDVNFTIGEYSSAVYAISFLVISLSLYAIFGLAALFMRISGYFQIGTGFQLIKIPLEKEQQYLSTVASRTRGRRFTFTRSWHRTSHAVPHVVPSSTTAPRMARFGNPMDPRFGANVHHPQHVNTMPIFQSTIQNDNFQYFIDPPIVKLESINSSMNKGVNQANNPIENKNTGDHPYICPYCHNKMPDDEFLRYCPTCGRKRPEKPQ